MAAVTVIGTAVVLIFSRQSLSEKCGCWLVTHPKKHGGETTYFATQSVAEVKHGCVKVNSRTPVDFSTARI